LNKHYAPGETTKFIKICINMLALPLALAMQTSSFAQSSIVTPLPANVQLVQTVEGITEYKLPNGLRILLAPDVSDQRVTINVTYMVGSRHEGYGETGMAHLLEHLIFKGSPKTPDPKAEFAKRGFSFNGTTTHDRTNYFANFQSDQSSIDWYLRWQADAMVNSFISRKDLDSEMTVVRNELERAESNPFVALGERVRASAYTWHNYGKSVLGAKSDLENVDITNLQNFYRRYYRPDNALVLVAGNFNPLPTLAAIAQAFGALKVVGSVPGQTYTLDPVQDGERSVVLRRPSTTQAFVIAYHIPPTLHPDIEPLVILNQALTAPNTGRLSEKMRGSVNGVFGFPILRREASTLMIGADFALTMEAINIQKTFFETVEGVANIPITKDEFERAKTAVNKNATSIFADANSTAAYAVEAAVAGDWRSLFVTRDRFTKVTLEDVNRVAKKYFLASNRTSGLLVPTEVPMRAPEPQLVDSAAYMQGFALNAISEVTENFDYSIANIRQSVVSSELEQGIKLSILQKSSRGDLVKLRMKLRFGSLDTLTDRVAASRMVNQLLTSGTPKYNREQIQDELNKLGITLNIQLYAGGGMVNMTAKKDQFAQAFDFTMHLLKESDFPVKFFYNTKNNWVKSAEGELKDKSALGNNAFNRYGNPYASGDPRYMSTTQEWLDRAKALTYEEVQKFYADFYGAQSAIVTVVGPVDPSAVKAQAQRLLETWRAPISWQRVAYPFVKLPPARLVYDTPDKANSTLRASIRLPLEELEIENWQLRLATRIFGGGPGSRLWTRVREEKGLSYDVSASVQLNSYDKNTGWSLYCDVAPGNLSLAEKTLQTELELSYAKGFTSEELARTKAQWLSERIAMRSGDEHALNLISAVQEFDQDWDLALKNDKLIASFTLDQINAVWRKYIATDQLVWAVFSDSAKTK
jgi:zinc protease